MIIRLPYAPRPNSAQKSARTESAGWLYVQYFRSFGSNRVIATGI